MNTQKDAPVGTPEVSLETQHKDSYFSQIQQVQISFFSSPATMMMVEKRCGVRREGICRYVKTMKKENAIWIVNVGRCPITGHNKVQYLTTNPQFVENQPQQLTLF